MSIGLKGVLLALLICFFVTSASAENLVYDASELDALTDKVFQRYKTVGGAVVVMRGDNLVYERYYGLSKKGERVPVDENTYFRLASITKWVTGMGVMNLVENGLLRLDENVGDVVDFPIFNPKYKNESITLRMIMTHTSSITDEGGFKNQNNTLSDIFSAAKRKSSFLPKAPGAGFEYSNFAAGIVGSMMEEVTGQSVNTFMKEVLFDPLEIDAAYSPTLLLRPEDIVNQHEADGVLARNYQRVLKEEYDDTANPNLHYRLTAGCLWMTPRDLGKLMAVMTGGGEYNGFRVLSEESVQMIHEEQVGKNGITANTPYALFCEQFTTLADDKIIYGHQGQSLSMVTEVFYDLETGFAMALLTNGCSKAIDRRICKIGRSMFDLMYPVFSN